MLSNRERATLDRFSAAMEQSNRESTGVAAKELRKERELWEKERTAIEAAILEAKQREAAANEAEQVVMRARREYADETAEERGVLSRREDAIEQQEHAAN